MVAPHTHTPVLTPFRPLTLGNLGGGLGDDEEAVARTEEEMAREAGTGFSLRRSSVSGVQS